MAVLQQLDRDLVRRTHEGHMPVARRTVDRHAHRGEARAGVVDVFDAKGEMAEIARRAIVLNRAVCRGPVVGELDFGFGAVLRGEKYQRVFALRVLRAARFGQTEACAEKAQACVEVAHADHGVQVAHNEYQALDE